MDALQYSIDQSGDVQTSDDLIAWSASSSWQRYWLFHRICQDHYLRTHGGPPAAVAGGNALVEKGVSLHPSLLNLGGCNALMQSIDQHMEEAVGDGPKDLQYIIPWTAFRANLLRRVLPQVISPEITATLEEYYGCHFQILAINMRRNFPSREQDVSFIWHRDFEPSQQVHLIVYLSGASDEGGRTEVLDAAATRAAAEAGYGFASLSERTDDLDRVFGRPASDVKVITPEFKPGGGLLFAAPRNLHRGRLPKSHWRDTLLLVFVPSPISWRERLAHTFENVLMNGPAVTSSMVNPLLKFAHSSLDNHGLPPDWASLGALYPPDGAP
jgi:hypothetical protein